MQLKLRAVISRIQISDAVPDDMYVCLCNALTDTQIRDAIAGGAQLPKEVYAACNCNAQCGCCTGTMLSIIREQPPGADQASVGD